MPDAAARLVDEALERWLSALQGLGALEPVQAAVTIDARILRYGWDEGRGLVRESFDGHEQIAAWCARTPKEVRFALGGAARARGRTWRVRYRVLLGDFESGGLWDLMLAADGRIAELAHQPDDLPAAWQDGIPDGKVLPGFMPEDFERARQAAIAQAERMRREGLRPEDLLSEGGQCLVGGHDHDHDHGTEP